MDAHVAEHAAKDIADPSESRKMSFESYHIHLGHLNQKSFDRVADDILARFPDGGKLLAVGDAAGEPSATIAKKWSGTIVSTDFVAGNKELGAKRAEALGLSSKLTFQTANACDLSQFED